MPVAAIDIGTNSVRVLVADETGRTLLRRMQITKLGQGVDGSGTLHPDAIGRTLAVLAEYGRDLADHGVTRVRATATSAARDATNSDEFFARATEALGVRPELIPGEEEARLAFAGATSGLPTTAQAPYLVIDVGGGSTEFVLGAAEPQALVSVAMGCVRMTERHLHGDPPTAAELAACERDADAVIREQVLPIVDLSRAQTVVGVAGTVSTLAMMDLAIPAYDADRIHHHRLSRTSVEALYGQLAAVSTEQRRGLLVEDKRAEVIVGGAAVLMAIMRHLPTPELLVSERDILDGLVDSLLRAP